MSYTGMENPERHRRVGFCLQETGIMDQRQMEHYSKGLHIINGVKYYFDSDGIMQTNTVVEGGKILDDN